MAPECRLRPIRSSTRRTTLSSCDLVVTNGHVATMSPERDGPYGAVRDALVCVDGHAISWVGPAGDAPRELTEDPRETIDLQGGWVTPGLVDAHTHLVFGGTRAAEFEKRLAGATYEDIARAGGGILSTVAATRGADAPTLRRTAAGRLGALIDQGVTTVEIKSGYGLDVETEMRMLEVARSLEELEPITVVTTLLGAHTIPPEHADDRQGYLDLVCDEMIPEAARRGLAHAVDAFCEGIAFTPDECERVLSAGRDHGLNMRLHADQLSDLGGAALAAGLGASSADHLEHTSREGVDAMARAGTAAVLLPGAFYFLGEGPRPPVSALREAGVAMVVATDLNPGSSPLVSPLLAMNLACVLFRLTPEEALRGMTRSAAAMLGLEDRGVIRDGARADLACWAIEQPPELSYWMGANPCQAVVSGGRRLR